MALPQYLLDNHQRIINASNQQITLWTSSYDDLRKIYPVVDEIYTLFPNRNIQRADVIQTFLADEYRGFIAAMMWGGINAKRPSKNGDSPNFIRLLSCDKTEVEKHISKAKHMIAQGQLRATFIDFLDGHSSLPGVGIAFFTKLFFYLGQIESAVMPVPLIFDKWIAFAHCAFRIQLLKPEESLVYKGIGYDEGRPYVKLPTGKSMANLYLDFVNDFAEWTDELNKICPDCPITVAKLEEFVFGQRLKNNPDLENPRRVLRDIVISYFEKEKPKETARGYKYQPLADFFSEKSKLGVQKIRLSLEEINTILRSTGGLPPNAYGTKSGFWRNAQENYHSQKKAWLYNGYLAEIEDKNGNRPLHIIFLKK